MCKVAYPKFATVYKPSSSLLELLSHPPHSHLPPSQMQLLTWFFLLWPLAIIYYYLGISNSFILYLGSYKSPNTPIFSATLSNTQCKSIFYIFSIKFWIDPNYIYLQMTWFWVLSYFLWIKVCSSVLYKFIFSNQFFSFSLGPVLFSSFQNTDDGFGKLVTLYLHFIHLNFYYFRNCKEFH